MTLRLPIFGKPRYTYNTSPHEQFYLNQFFGIYVICLSVFTTSILSTVGSYPIPSYQQWDYGNILEYGGHPEPAAEATFPTRIYFLGRVRSQGDFLDQCARLKFLPTVVEVVRKSPRPYGSCRKWTGPPAQRHAGVTHSGLRSRPSEWTDPLWAEQPGWVAPVLAEYIGRGLPTMLNT